MKKGQISTTTKMMAIAVSAILLFVFGTTLFAGVDKITDRTGCSLSMIARTGTTIEAGGGLIQKDSPVSASCPRYFVTFYDDKVEIKKGTEKAKKKKHDELTNDVVNREVVEQLRGCWAQFGAGKLDAFWEPSIFWGDLGDNDRLCYLCAEITFDKSVKTNKFERFYEYINKRTITGKKEGEGLKLYEYIAENNGFCQEEKFPGDNCWEGYASKKNIDVKPDFYKDKKYVVLFIRHGKDKEETTLNSYVIPISEMNKQCDGYVS